MEMNPELFINAQAKLALKELYGAEVEERLIQTQATRKEFEGDITLVTFPLLKTSHKGPEQTAEEIGRWLKERCSEVESFNVVKGFLNIKFSYKNNLFGRNIIGNNTDVSPLFCGIIVSSTKKSVNTFGISGRSLA